MLVSFLLVFGGHRALQIRRRFFTDVMPIWRVIPLFIVVSLYLAVAADETQGQEAPNKASSTPHQVNGGGVHLWVLGADHPCGN